MISAEDGVFRLTADALSYWFRVTKFGHLEHIHFGARLADQAVEPLLHKRTAVLGSSVLYDASDPTYCLDTLCLEWSGIGRGDYRITPAELFMPDGTFTADFQYVSHRIFDGPCALEALPGATGTAQECQTLTVLLLDSSNHVELTLYYTVYPACNVITRRTVLRNLNERPCTIRKLMSLSVDLPNRGFSLATFDGGWIKEAHRHDRELQYGTYSFGSTTGASSNRHNPGFLLFARDAGEAHGAVYGFNLIYSGNHIGLVERAHHDLLRVQTGIHPQGFSWTLGQGESFETPEAVMTFSDRGFNGTSAHFHDFVNRHIVRGPWRDQVRPVLYNGWEACFFRFRRRKLLKLAQEAKRLGIGLFVLDDGWFGARNNDHAGLGDYTVNRKKLPGGLAPLSRALGRRGLAFGLWFEPEMVNQDSDLFRAHPEYAVSTPGKQPTLGRNQLVLDLTNPEVRDYIVRSVGGVLDGADIRYVKWDMNRHISDAYSPCLSEQGRFHHAYILGLYDVLRRIFGPRPHILLESCSSGGNRFDLGMLCFSPQIWVSDDTDPIERLSIQQGLSYLYPLSTMGAHVSDAPHQQTLRDTPLPTRFHAAAFGCLGYEMDLRLLSPAEKREIRSQIAFYRAHARTLQFGRFYRGVPERDGQVRWTCVAQDGSEAVTALFQIRAHASPPFDRLRVPGLSPEAAYLVTTRPQHIAIRRFGGLVKHLLPFSPRPDGLLLRIANRLYALPDCVEEYRVHGDALASGILLNNQFTGSYYNRQTRLLGDYGSNLYLICKLGNEEATA